MVEIKTTTLTSSTTFPILDQFEDYHYIEDRARDLSKQFGRRIASWEVGFCENGQYWGLFYVGRRPNKAAIKQLMDDAKYVSMYNDEE